MQERKMDNPEPPENKSLEDILSEMESKKDRRKMDMTKFLPVGWSRLTNEQRTVLQEMIYRFIEINKSKSKQT
jgi:hypothetical protein